MTGNAPAASPSPGGDITGYQLLMATPESGEVFTVVADTVHRSIQALEYLVGAPAHTLVTGSTYRFKVIAYNMNGPSTASSIADFLVCGAPAGLS